MEEPLINQFCPQPPVGAHAYRLIHVPSAACDAIIFNVQEQLCHRTSAGGRDLSNRVMIGTIQSRRQLKNSEGNLVPPATCTSFHMIWPTILKAFPKTFLTERKPRKCGAKEKVRGKKSETEGSEKAKSYSHKILLSAHVQTSEADMIFGI